MNGTIEPKGRAGTAPPGPLLADITTRMVRLHKEYYGRGPTRGRSHWHEDVIVVVLQGGLTIVEEALRDANQAELVVSQRAAVQEALRDRFTSAITELTGRDVTVYVSGVEPKQGTTVHVFVLAPSS
jgi:uncharacterized protein YbcI